MKVWLSLINDEELQQFKRDIKKRFESAMQPFFFLAFLTDHRKFDSDVQLNDTQENDAEEWLESYDHDLFQSFSSSSSEPTTLICIPTICFLKA